MSKARECKAVLRAQLLAQEQRISLEVQEKENAKLETELSRKEQERGALDRAQERHDILQSECARLDEETRVCQHNLALELERAKAEFVSCEQQLEHEINLKEIELQHHKQEKSLQRRLLDAQRKKAEAAQGDADQPREGENPDARNAQIGSWLEGVREGRPGHRDTSPAVAGLASLSCDPVDPTYNSMVQGLVNSGMQILTQVGLDQNTTQFIASQAMRAKGKTMGVSRSRSVNKPPVATSTAHEPFVLSARTHAGSMSPPSMPITMTTADNEERAVAASSQPAGHTMRMSAFAQGNIGHGVEDDQLSEGELVASSIHCKKTVKSGMVAKATYNIKSQEVWPHYNLNYAYVIQPIEFHQITYEQYIAGEAKTLLNSTDPNEIRGRLNLLIRISYLKQKGHVWSNLRTLYAASVNHIEKHESSWVLDWRHIEDMVLDTAIRVPGEKSRGRSVKSTNKQQVFYCANFNQIDGCQLNTLHDAQVGRRRRSVRHICAKCWNVEQEMRDHSEVDPHCPHHD